MDFEDVLKLAPVVGVVVGLGIFYARQGKVTARLRDQIRAELSTVESLSLPELVTRAGLRDGFMSRGKLMNIINPMVASGELSQEEPPGTTIKNRLSVLRFRLRTKP